MQSLQYRLGILLGILLVIIFGLHLVLINFFPRYLAEEHVLTRLQHDSDTLLSRLIIQSDQQLHLQGRFMSPIYVLPYSGHYFHIKTDNSVLRSTSLQDENLTHPPTHFGKSTISRIMGPNQQYILVWTQVIKKDGHRITLSVAEDISDIEDDIAELQRFYVLVTLTTVLLFIALQTFIIRKTLRPIKQVRYEILAIERGELEKIEQRVPTEIQPLVNEINHLLISMQKRIERSRNATGNLAHALKTPLSVLTQLVDAPEIKDHPAFSKEINQIAQRIKEAIERELRRSRLAGISLPGQQFDVTKELSDLVLVIEKIYAHKQVNITLIIPKKKIFQGDREDMLELFGNLLDNACKWAKQHIIVTIEERTGLLHCVIEDDGKGIQQQELEMLMQRGKRLDESTTGHGLGLSIVKEIVEQYKGNIDFSRSTVLGGLKVTLSF